MRRLFREYAASLEIDLGYQDFEAEFAALPGKYAPPLGELFLAGAEDGCIGVRPLAENGVCEMKRLYVAASGRGQGLGQALVETAIDFAKRAGYREMRLDTLDTMTPAIALYRKFGFEEIPAYYDTPVGCSLFMALRLS